MERAASPKAAAWIVFVAGCVLVLGGLLLSFVPDAEIAGLAVFVIGAITIFVGWSSRPGDTAPAEVTGSRVEDLVAEGSSEDIGARAPESAPPGSPASTHEAAKDGDAATAVASPAQSADPPERTMPRAVSVVHFFVLLGAAALLVMALFALFAALVNRSGEALVGGLVLAALGALWAWLASNLAKGKHWAALWILFLVALGVLSDFALGGRGSAAFGAVMFVVYLVLLTRPSAREFLPTPDKHRPYYPPEEKHRPYRPPDKHRPHPPP